MKLSRVILAPIVGLGLLLSIPLPKAQVRLAEPRPAVEYNVGFCGGQSFTVMHVVLSENEKHEQTMDFNYHIEGALDAPVVAKEEGDDHAVFAAKLEPKDDDGNVKYHAEAKLGDKKLVINGLLRGEHLIGLMLVDGELGHVLYGRVGKVDDMVKVVGVDYRFCIDLHQSGVEAIPQSLADWLKQAEAPEKDLNKS